MESKRKRFAYWIKHESVEESIAAPAAAPDHPPSHRSSVSPCSHLSPAQPARSRVKHLSATQERGASAKTPLRLFPFFRLFVEGARVSIVSPNQFGVGRQSRAALTQRARATSSRVQGSEGADVALAPVMFPRSTCQLFAFACEVQLRVVLTMRVRPWFASEGRTTFDRVA